MTSLSANELKSAELELVKNVQHKHFSYLFSGSHSTLHNSHLLFQFIKKLHPIIVNGVIRVGDTLQRVDVEFDQKHLILLPKNCHFTELVIHQYHCQVGHSGTSHTWSAIWQKFRVLMGGTAVRRTIDQSTKCKRHNAPDEEQLMVDLPSPRLQINQPSYSHVGVNYLGPYQVKQGWSIVKRYGCVCPCLWLEQCILKYYTN